MSQGEALVPHIPISVSGIFAGVALRPGSQRIPQARGNMGSAMGVMEALRDGANVSTYMLDFFWTLLT